MKLTVLVPSEEYRSSAGTRIRYARLTQPLGAAGLSLSLESIGNFDPSTAECDAVLISKCHDARSIIAAAILSRRGKLVGVDLFDDYFSQAADSRLIRYREWLADLLEDCDFCLCSTQMMAEVVRRYKPQLTSHVVNDPARDHSAEDVFQLAKTKIADARRERRIRAAWFGVGDNPYFSVGLVDLAAHASALNELTHGGMAVDLTILTNRRALGADGLELISRLPVPCTVMEWTEELEQQVLARSLVAFLPVAAQSFSAAKSLNRAVTALTYGCQVLSAGYPLYADLEPLIYREPAALLSDIEERTLRLNGSEAEVYKAKLRALGTAETEALRLAQFLKGVRACPKEPARICVVHGLSTRVEIHQLAQAVGGLSVASPYCSAYLDFDAVFRGLPPNMKMTASSRTSAESVRSRPVAFQMATYAASMREIARKLQDTFGPIRLIIAETSRVPVTTAEA
jgi:hypothetical protein